MRMESFSSENAHLSYARTHSLHRSSPGVFHRSKRRRVFTFASDRDANARRSLSRPPANVENGVDTTTPVAASTKPGGLYGLSFLEAMAFKGPVPEKVNGRLAMLMFIPLMQREMATGETVVEQFSRPDWKLVLAALIVCYATIVPSLKGVIDEDFFCFSVRGERLNGRLAMLGWLGLIIAETYARACFF